MLSGFGPSSFSNSRKEFRMISSCKMKYKSNLPLIFCLCGLGKLYWPGRACSCREKWESVSNEIPALPFSLEFYQNLGTIHRYIKYLQDHAIQTLRTQAILRCQFRNNILISFFPMEPCVTMVPTAIISITDYGIYHV